MRWLPRLYLHETTMCFDDGEAEGWLIGFVWRGLFVELSVARHTRRVG
jgi:hypothetical protein